MQKYEGVHPVPLLELAHDLGLEVNETDEFPDHKSGSLLHEGGKFKIYINVHHPMTRRRFTVAHEIGHFLLHRDKLVPNENDEHVDSIKTHVQELKREDERELGEEERLMEIEANNIAAAILMPEYDFRQAFKVADDLKEVAEKFKVSEAAAAIRAENLLGATIM